MSKNKVWVQLYIGGGEKSGDEFEIQPIPDNINALKVAVKGGRPVALCYCDAADLTVYGEQPYQKKEMKLLHLGCLCKIISIQTIH